MVSPADVQQYLEGFDYPEEGASKDDLVQYAESKGAPEEVVTALRSMPGDTFSSSADVSDALGTEDEEEA